MNWQAFADSEGSSRLCWTLLHSLWQVALLATVARGASWLCGRRAVERSYAIHAAALALALALLPLTFWWIGSGSSSAVTNVTPARYSSGQAVTGSELAQHAAAEEPPLVLGGVTVSQPLASARAAFRGSAAAPRVDRP